MRQELKTDPEVFAAVLAGTKTYEIRLDDRNFQVGDELFLRETKFSGAEMRAGAPLDFTGRELTRIVSHKLTGYGLLPGWCNLSFKITPFRELRDGEIATIASRFWGLRQSGGQMVDTFDEEGFADAILGAASSPATT